MNKTKEEKLKEIIEKAYRNGLEHYAIYEDYDINSQASIRGILFSHDFAKKYFGEYPPEDGYEKNPFWKEHSQDNVKYWQYHLQQAVISDDVIDYYYQFI